MKKLLLFLAFLSVFVFVSKANPVDLRFLELNINSELSSTFVTAIEQDELGFMWFGTTNGLHRFDGYEMKKYLSNEGESYGINESNIFELFSDSYGDLWISLNSYVCIYDYVKDSIKVVSSEKNRRGLESYYISCYFENKDSILYVSSINAIYQYNRDSLYFNEVLKIPHGEISNFTFDNKGNIWISTINGGGFYYCNIENNKYESLSIPSDNIKKSSIYDIEYYDDKIWLATEGQGLFSYDIHSKEFYNYPSDSEYSLNVLEIYIDKDSLLWIVDFTSIKQYLKERDFFQAYYNDENNIYSAASYAKNIFQDKNYNYWTIHSPGGVGFSPKPKGINRFDSKVNSPFRLSVNNVSTICEDAYGNLWIGNPFNGIDVFRWSEGRTQTYQSNSSPNSLGNGATQYIFKDSKQQMWIGTYWGGLQKFREKTNDFISFIHDPNNDKSISSNDIRFIDEDKNGNLWLCSHGRGIDMYNPVKDEFTNYNFANNQLANNYTFSVLCDSSNNIWVATSWGLSVLKEGETIFNNFFYIENNDSSLASNVVNTIYEDELGRIWIGSTKGLQLFLPETKNFRNYSNGLANKNICSISSDLNNCIWVSTFNGIARLNVETGKITNLNKNDGLISNSFILNAIYNNGINTLFFGSIDGLSYFEPLKIKFNEVPPDIYITKLKIQNNEITCNNSDYLKNNIVVSKSIELKYSDKIFEIEFSALNYVDANKNSYAYCLEGFENDWKYIGNKRSVTYTNLNPGRYIFKVKAANNEGVWNDKGIEFEVFIKPPFWKTLIFRMALILILISVLVIFIRFRENNLRNINVLLEQKVKERTLEINEQKNELEKKKIELMNANNLKNRFFSVLAHDLRGPVLSILQLLKMIKEKQPDLNFDSLRKINLSIQAADTTYNLLEDLLIWGKSQTDNIDIVFEQLNLLNIVDQCLKSFNQVAFNKDISINIRIPNDVEIFADSNTIKVVIRNLISNALKFSNKQSVVDIYSNITKDKVIICFADQGVGMEAVMVNSLFNSQIKYSNIGTLGEKGSGLGLSLCKELIAKNNGEIWVESKINVGSKFYISIPIKLSV